MQLRAYKNCIFTNVRIGGSRSGGFIEPKLAPRRVARPGVMKFLVAMLIAGPVVYMLAKPVQSISESDFDFKLAYALSSDAELIAGKRTVEIEAILGYRGRDEMIHRDDLILTGNGT